MEKIKVNWQDVEIAFERNVHELSSYIDKQTGDVHFVMADEPDSEALARQIEDEPDRYVEIEPASSKAQYSWMEQFVATLEDDYLKQRLQVAIDGKGAFRRFKDVLLAFPVARERWFNFKSAHLRYLIQQWFDDVGYDPDPAAPWGRLCEPAMLDISDIKEAQMTGEGPAEQLRKQVRSLVDLLPAGELPAAQTFLEFLQERGGTTLTSSRGKIDDSRLWRRRAGMLEADRGESGDSD